MRSSVKLIESSGRIQQTPLGCLQINSKRAFRAQRALYYCSRRSSLDRGMQSASFRSDLHRARRVDSITFPITERIEHSRLCQSIFQNHPTRKLKRSTQDIFSGWVLMRVRWRWRWRWRWRPEFHRDISIFRFNKRHFFHNPSLCDR
jgi:hypothetical protein